MNDLSKETLLRIMLDHLGFLEPALYQQGWERLTCKDAQDLARVIFLKGRGRDLRYALNELASPEEQRRWIIQILTDIQGEIQRFGEGDIPSMRALLGIITNRYLPELKRINETPFLELLCFMYTQPEEATRKLAFPLILADDWRKKYLSMKYVASEPLDRPFLPINFDQTLYRAVLVHLPSEDFTDIAYLVEERKRLDEALLTTIKTERAQQKTIGRLTVSVNDLERRLKGQEKEIQQKTSEYHMLKTRFDALAQGNITRKDHESALEDLRTEVQLYEESNTSLKEALTHERTRTEQFQKEKLHLEDRLKKLDARSIEEIQREAVEVMYKYKGKRVVIWGGHVDQARRITQLLEPYGARVDHTPEEHVGNREPPMGADLIIHYIGHISHKAGKVLESYNHPHVVKFGETKAQLIPSLISWAKQHFNNSNGKNKPE
ncbi:MAG: hypothetical protein AABX86_01535 [Nanoarchaeota archaeon]